MTRIKFYAKLTDEEANIIDEIIETLDYESRTDFITALLKTVIYGEQTAIHNPEIDAVSSCAMTLDTLRTVLFEILDEYAFPIIAMRGADTAYKALHDDMKTWMYDRCHTIPDEDRLKQWLHLYQITRKSRIIQYRIQLMTADYCEEHGIETAPQEASA